MIDRVEQGSQNPISIYVILAGCCFVLSIEAQSFAYWTVQVVFLEYFHKDFATCDYSLTTQKSILSQWSHHIHSITFLAWSPPLELEIIAFFIEHWKKAHFFLAHKTFLRNCSFLCLKKRLVAIDIWSSLFSSLRVWRRQTPSLLTFPLIFKWLQNVDWDVL